ncbi:hypothetical protein F2Q69_00052418 [Brassica cretica]|uniref:Replication factor A C-terminal domain-containing protein n=1 Tax=Brassica cretica TaxID=69181 RepID=A0A8S9N550_BRACR|nr:hypothetical protein F2Q69_00052418 [Brassica cretica]
MINGFIPADRAKLYRPSLQEGNIFKVAHFEVERCPHMYKTTDHPFVIRFITETTLDQLITIEVYLSLLDDAAAVFKAVLNSVDRTHNVMVVTNMTSNLNSTAATKFYIGTNLPAIKDFTANLSGAVGQDSPILHDDTVITNKQLTSIGDLNMFLSKPTDQEPYFISKARIVEVLTQNGWHYVSCNHCGKKLDNSAASLPCNQCLHANASGTVLNYWSMMGIIMPLFLVFNKEMLKLIKQDAATLLHDEVNGGVCNILPQCLAELEEQAFVFHVHVTPHNFTPNTPTFTVSGIRDNTNTETLQINETASVQVKYGNQQLWYLPATRQQMRSKKVDAHTQGSDRFKAIQT